MEGRKARQLGEDVFDPNDDPKCPNAVTSTVHDRMPVILDPDAYDVWLDPGMTNVAAASGMIPTAISSSSIIGTRLHPALPKMKPDRPASPGRAATARERGCNSVRYLNGWRLRSLSLATTS
ncbi:MAG TPA: SOS response-associated peptidase family protein [Candidatus Polarisedimenticolia bacterium]|nr:SOS response-associated peptidase family protein [Candidatus Polarisedimenticolia bacterium]